MSKIDASPTKQFFITMLTRDVALDRSILDLVDNSVDAAVRSNDLNNKKVEITVSKEKFVIRDNCGGIKQTDAESYAFRFGRTEDNPGSQHSVGQFGVGLKRTLFKIGEDFKIISRHSDSWFEVKVNVPEWIKTPVWEFDLTPINRDREDQPLGTEIIVTSLRKSTSDQFSLNTFAREIIDEISRSHFKSIKNGLKVLVNEEEVGSYVINVFNSEKLVGISQEFVIDGAVNVGIKVGFSERDFHAAGWNIVCNGRLVADSERSEITGWGVDKMPRYHPDYAFFRGVVEFDADDSSLLPWTTTKTGVDVDNSVYIQALHHMKMMMRPALSLMSARAAEQRDLIDEKIEHAPLVEAFECKEVIDIYNAAFGQEMVSPERAVATNLNPMTTIQYKVPVRKINIVKASLGVSSNKDVGESTFQYFYDMECDDE
jgi:hypothetical protein